MKVLIVGAGFGGLALAAYLHKDGHTVTIVEKKLDRPQAGFVIGLWRNGIHTLEPFGVVERIQHLSIAITEEVIRDQTGKIIAKMDYQPLIDHYGPVFLLLHADLHEILRELTADVPIHFGTTVSKFEEQQQGISVTLSNGSREDFDLVVGADGVHSQVRHLLFGDEGLTYSGLKIWFSLLPAGKERISEPNDLFFRCYRSSDSGDVVPRSCGLTGRRSSRRFAYNRDGRSNGTGRCTCPDRRVTPG